MDVENAVETGKKKPVFLPRGSGKNPRATRGVGPGKGKRVYSTQSEQEYYDTRETPSHSWERLPGEGRAAYESFCIYRELGPQRSLKATYRIRAKKPTATQASGTYTIWQRQFNWLERAKDYDDFHKQELEQAKLAANAEEVQALNLARAAFRTDAKGMARRLWQRAEDMLEFPLAEQQVKGPNGENITIKPVHWTMGHVAEMIKCAKELWMLALLMDDDKGGATIKNVDVRMVVLQEAGRAGWSQAETQAALLYAEEMARSVGGGPGRRILEGLQLITNGEEDA